MFALALGLLVSAGSPPETCQQLFPHLQNIVPVAAGFVIMVGISSYRQAGNITGWFSLGYALVYGVIHQMYLHANRRADILGLSPIERQITRRSIWAYRFEILIATIAGLIAVFTLAGPFAGFLYALNWPIEQSIKRALKLPEPEVVSE